jgi:endonuclease-3
MAAADPTELERLIHPTGFFRQKARSILGLCERVLAEHGGEIPKTLEELTRLPGVGRKTANVVLGNAFGIPGIVVDTHVSRLSQRMNLTRESDPVKIERDLMELVPEKDWTQFSHAMIFHGRRTCGARNPECELCPVYPDCPFPRQPKRVARGAAKPRGPRRSRS